MKSNSETQDIAREVVQAQQGNRDSLSRLIHLTHVRLYRFCLYLVKNPHVAQDLSQEGYLKALENIHTLQEPTRFISWLCRLTKNIFLQSLRGPRGKDTSPLQNVAELAWLPQQDVSIQIAQALETLPPDDRELLLLVDLEGHSYEEAAEILNISPRLVKSRLHRIRMAVEKAFGS